MGRKEHERVMEEMKSWIKFGHGKASLLAKYETPWYNEKFNTHYRGPSNKLRNIHPPIFLVNPLVSFDIAQYPRRIYNHTLLPKFVNRVVYNLRSLYAIWRHHYMASDVILSLSPSCGFPSCIFKNKNSYIQCVLNLHSLY